ncbi:unnamed protein product [Paramecium sonneborni]|uniref:TLDc domain-containing protein n=1 Tax=Paramecium sonneborni TaxID=65129 RepID=A0A8S1M1N9_9CILI|nr:unnamed protein product [Paramecium sonneborni]
MQPPQPPKVPPQPQKVMCDQKKDQEAKYVGFPYQKPPMFMSKKYFKKEVESNKKLLYFKLEDITKDWQNAFLYFDRDYLNPLNYYCKYIKDQSFFVTEEEIDQAIDKLQEEILFKTDQMREELKKQLAEHQKYYKEKVLTYNQPYSKIQNSYENFVNCLLTHKYDNLQSQQNLKKSVTDLGNIITKSLGVSEFKQDPIVEKTDNLRKNQTKFINKNIWDHYQNKILSELKSLQDNYISHNSFTETSIPNQDYIFEIFQKIKEDKEYKDNPSYLRHELKDKLVMLFKTTNQGLFKELQNQKEDLKNNITIALIKTSTDQSIGFYHNGKRKETSLLFSLTKRIAFNVKANQELKIADDEHAKISLQFGRDLVIPNDFKDCTSQLGDAFDLRGEGEKIGNLEEFLGNGIHFDIEYFELYKVNDPDLAKQPLRQTYNQPPNTMPFQPPYQYPPPPGSKP